MKWNWQRHISSLLLLFSLTAHGQGLLMDYTLQNAPQQGILIQNVSGFERRAQIIRDSLHSPAVRMAIQLDGWTGSNSVFDLYTDSGLTCHVEIGCDSAGTQPVPWIDNYAGAASTLDDILTTYPQIQLIVLDNEEMNPSYHTGTILQYTTLAAALSPICKLHNVKLANGGFGNTFAISCYTFRYLKSVYGQDTADAFGDRVFLNLGQYNAANTPNSNPALEFYFLQADSIVKSLAWDVINFHNYEPSPPSAIDPNTNTTVTTNVWRFYAEALANGNPLKYRKVMSNEFGQRYNLEGDLMTDMMNISYRLGLLYFDKWAGNDGTLGATSVCDDDGTLNNTGKAFRNWNLGIFD